MSNTNNTAATATGSKFIEHGESTVLREEVCGTLVVNNTAGSTPTYGSVCLDKGANTSSWHKTETLEEAIESMNNVRMNLKGKDFFNVKDHFCIPSSFVKKLVMQKKNSSRLLLLIGSNEEVMFAFNEKHYSDFDALNKLMRDRLHDESTEMINLDHLMHSTDDTTASKEDKKEEPELAETL